MEKYVIYPKNYCIMIIDDDNIERMITEEGLCSVGYHIKSFAKPQDAISYYRNHFYTIDFIIIDMKMPGINGAGTFYKLQKINPFLLSVVLSGYDNVDKEYQYLLMDGLKGFLRKPISIDALDDYIKKILYKNFGFNVKAGLATLLNNINIYKKVLQTYYEENKNLSKELINLLEKSDFDKIELLVHKIKGISLNLGASNLYKYAFNLNRHLKDRDFDITEIIDFTKYHNLLIKDLERLLGVLDVQ